MQSQRFDLETETTPLLPQSTTLDNENQVENVEVSINEEEEEEDSESDCTHDFPSIRSVEADGSEEEVDENENEISFTTGGIARKSSTNEPFFPSGAHLKSYIQRYKECIKRLGLENKIYKGRPKLNTKYFNWCINEGFTQCSGPVEDENHNLICCKDLPRNKIVQEDVNAEKIWVLSAGPKRLVENVRLWSSEYGLKFHEEAFYA
ncbi:unnamed protein product [Candida verbasci]|uniref:Uncharacterized protein n=1 Tax=Candida verbasci TaxID=1227364 RepID=A0A9W4U002_9ASCO|nr:unnamed protein product [Candida verbasci]